MFQTFEFGGNVVSLYSTVDGQLAFGEMIEKLTNRHCKILNLYFQISQMK